jgi:dihydroflavonol-4-reductase
MGSVQNKICIAYYKDTAQGFLLAHARGKPGDDYILGSENLTFTEIWKVVAKVLGKHPLRARIPLWMIRNVSQVRTTLTGKSILPPEFFEMVGLNWNFSAAKVQRDLGWKPHSFLEGLVDTWAGYQAAGWRP